MKTKPVLLVGLVSCLLTWPYQASAAELNQLSPAEREAGFQLLFDGRSMDQWRNLRSDTIRPEWKVLDGQMVLTEKGGRDLITRATFGHFDLRLEYTISEGGNAGIMFRVVEESDAQFVWHLAPEFQLYDSFNVQVRAERSAGALYGLVAAPQGIAKEPGEWNRVRILLEPAPGDTERLQCWLNGTQTIDLVVDHAPDSEWSKQLAAYNLEKKDTKYELPDRFFKAKTGPILLQDHGARTAFRNIRIRELDSTTFP